MVDKFGGYRRGRPGPPGPSGKNAIQLHEWCPKSLIEMFRKDEECTFYFDTETDGILYKDGKPIGLKDRFGGKNAICLQNFYKPEKIRKVYFCLFSPVFFPISVFCAFSAISVNYALFRVQF